MNDVLVVRAVLVGVVVLVVRAVLVGELCLW